jgi:hypothetical protein
MTRGWLGALSVAVAALTCAVPASAGAAARTDPGSVFVEGTVSAPMSYSSAHLRALPQTTAQEQGRRAPR